MTASEKLIPFFFTSFSGTDLKQLFALGSIIDRWIRNFREFIKKCRSGPKVGKLRGAGVGMDFAKNHCGVKKAPLS